MTRAGRDPEHSESTKRVETYEVYSVHAYLLQRFLDRSAAIAALHDWPQATVVLCCGKVIAKKGVEPSPKGSGANLEAEFRSILDNVLPTPPTAPGGGE